MSKKILFRVDANSIIGFGHLYRCIAISEHIQSSFECYFLTKTLKINLIQEIKNVGKHIALNVCNIKEEIQFILDVCKKEKIRIVVLDGYNFNQNYQKLLKNEMGLKLVSIDDFQQFNYASDVVINHAESIDHKNFKCSSQTKFFTGFEYLMIRKSFFEVNANKSSNKIPEIKNLFISFGGSDINNNTLRFTKIIGKTGLFDNIHVLINDDVKLRKELEQFSCNLVKTKVHIHQDLNAETISGILQNTQLSVVPSSTIGLEAFVSGNILLTGTTAKNQENIYNSLRKNSGVIGLGDMNQVSDSEILTKLNRLISTKNLNISSGKKIKDNRLIEIFKELI